MKLNRGRGLVLDGVRLAVRGRPLLALDAAVQPGETLTVMGPSGSGKSALLSFIGGTLAPDFVAAGRILLDGRDLSGLPAEQRRVGILFQDPLLFPHLSVGGNLMLAIPPSPRGRLARRRLAETALERAELPGLADRDPATLSGGQQARVALLRTLLAEPAAVLLDEPFARLDLPLRGRMRSFVFGAIRERGLPALLVTHDPADAAAAGGRVVTIGVG